MTETGCLKLQKMYFICWVLCVSVYSEPMNHESRTSFSVSQANTANMNSTPLIIITIKDLNIIKII
jgi:hypothetical protein